MLDILLFREDGGNPNLIRESQRRRGKDVGLVDKVLQLDAQWKDTISKRDEARMDKNKISKEIGKAKKAGGDASELMERSKGMDATIKALEAEAERLLGERDATVSLCANLVHEDVPISLSEDDNRVEREWGPRKSPTGPTPTGAPAEHAQLLQMVGGVDLARGSKVAGHRGYFLRGVGVRLNLALQQFALDFLEELGYSPTTTPLFMTQTLMSKTAQLEDFDESLYKIEAHAEGDAKYLIATAEQPISAMHAGEWLLEKQLPIRYAGVSACFRKEAGSAGRDIRGIFRVHQFEKVEQFVICEPEASWGEQDRMIEAAQAFYEALGLSYQVINIVSGALNNAAAKKLDLEVWFPQQQKYRELVSCSNCTDYQARALEVRCGAKVKGEKKKKYVHMLNSTLMASTRSICAILENGQTPDGIVIPEVLRPYMGGKEKIPYVKSYEDVIKEEKNDEKAKK